VAGVDEGQLQLLVPVVTRDGEVWISRHAVERFVEREQAVRRGPAMADHRVVSILRGRMKGGRIQKTAPSVPVTGDEDGYLVTGAYVWPLRRRDDGSWIALTTIDR
jgi:hypothetical protein